MPKAGATPAQGREIVLVGHAGHAEVEGTIGQIPGRVHLVQTVADVATLEVSDPTRLPTSPRPRSRSTTRAASSRRCRQRFPAIVGPDVRDICYATQNRQQAVHDLAKQVDRDPGRRLQEQLATPTGLREIGTELGKPSYLIDDASALEPEWFEGVARVGLTAGASAPEMLVQGVLDGLRRFGEVNVSTLAGVAEDVKFKFPAEVS